MSIPLLLAAIASSYILILWLWHGDPKRRRVARLPSTASNRRRLIAMGAVLPGLILAATGDSAAFLIWLGACAIGGWLTAQFRYGVDVD